MAETEYQSRIREFLGLEPRALAARTLESAMDRRRAALNLPSRARYLACLEQEPDERAALLGLLIVPETWFFRDQASLREAAAAAARSSRRPVKALSAGCSTGEEAYSIAMALIQAGLDPGDFRVDAMDVHGPSLEKAQKGIYGQNSFRERGWDPPRDFFLDIAPGKKQVAQKVGNTLRWVQGSVLEPPVGELAVPYDLIFFRNVLIYFSDAARKKAVDNLDRMLAPGGAVVLGFAESRAVFFPDYMHSDTPRSYVCYKPGLRQKKKVSEAAPKRPAYKKTARAQTLPTHIQTPTKAPAKPLGEVLKEDRPDKARPDAPQLVDLARRLAGAGDLDQARLLLEQSLDMDPGIAEAWHLLGCIGLAAESEDQARRSFEKALYLDPGHKGTLTQLSLLMEKLGKTEQAKRFRERALRTGDK